MRRVDADVAELSWPVDEAQRLMGTLARHAGLVNRAADIPPPGAAAAASGEAFDAWLSTVASIALADARPHTVAYADVDTLLGRSVPIVLRLPGRTGSSLVGLIGGRKKVQIVTRAHGCVRLSRTAVTTMLRAEVEEAYAPIIDALLAGAELTPPQAQRARSALLLEHAGDRTLAEAWSLHAVPAETFLGELWRSGVGTQVLGYLAANSLHYAMLLWVWAVAGQWALGGSYSTGRFVQWLLLLATAAALFLYGRWAEGMISIGINALMKERLLDGALQFDRDRLRAEGPSRLLGRVLESNTIQTVMVEGVFGATVATVEASAAVAVLGMGVVGWKHASVFVLWIIALAVAHYVGYRRRAEWTDARVGLTQDLVEKMIGYRTRLAQQPISAWHDGEDEALCHNHALARKVDHWGTVVEMIAARGWILAATGMLLPSILAGARPVDVAISIGGILLAESALLRYLPAAAMKCGSGEFWCLMASKPMRGSTHESE